MLALVGARHIVHVSRIRVNNIYNFKYRRLNCRKNTTFFFLHITVHYSMTSLLSKRPKNLSPFYTLPLLFQHGLSSMPTDNPSVHDWSRTTKYKCPSYAGFSRPLFKNVSITRCIFPADAICQYLIREIRKHRTCSALGRTSCATPTHPTVFGSHFQCKVAKCFR